MNKIKATLKAYTGGIVDGEGCIDIHVKNTGKGHSLRLEVTNTEKCLLDFLEKNWKLGKVMQRAPQKGNHKACYTWRLNGKDAIKVLKSIYSFLIIKKKAANIAFKFYKTVNIVPNGVALPLVIINKRRKWKLQMQKTRNKVAA